MKRIALFLDGTWNDPGSNTHVWRAQQLLADKGDDGVNQIKFYAPGVGVRWYEKLSGGVLGKGLSRNVLEAYAWLMGVYDEGDEIFVFGYSRGAFTARSLCGMIAGCGLLRAGTPLTPEWVYKCYRSEKVPLYRLRYLERHSDKRERDFTADEIDHLRYSHDNVEIQFIGVWDTVGALGIPFGDLPGISRRSLRFHNPRLSSIYRHCYHAIAIDEHRKPYEACLWKRFTPLDDHGNPLRNPEEDEPEVEQRWFAGAHSNVGGGDPGDQLAQLPLEWIVQKAEACGLAFRPRVPLDGNEHGGALTDSFARFLRGLYRVVRLGRRYYRTIQRPAGETVSKTGQRGRIETINETIDGSVCRRLKDKPNYQPRNLPKESD